MTVSCRCQLFSFLKIQIILKYPNWEVSSYSKNTEIFHEYFITHFYICKPIYSTGTKGLTSEIEPYSSYMYFYSEKVVQCPLFLRFIKNYYVAFLHLRIEAMASKSSYEGYKVKIFV